MSRSDETFKCYFKGYKWYSSGNHHIYIYRNKEENMSPIEMRDDKIIRRWKGNRRLDENRVIEIEKVQNSTEHIYDTIKLAYINGDNHLVVYDGLHRLEALTNTIKFVIFDVIWNVTEDDIHRELNIVNSHVPLSDAYKEKESEDVKLHIEKFVKNMCKEYKDLVCIRHNPNKPYFNRDDLIQDIYEIWKDNEKRDIEKIFDAIEKLNRDNKRYYQYHSPTNDNAIYNKCCNNRLWLFYKNKDIKFSDIKKYL